MVLPPRHEAWEPGVVGGGRLSALSVASPHHVLDGSPLLWNPFTRSRRHPPVCSAMTREFPGFAEHIRDPWDSRGAASLPADGSPGLLPMPWEPRDLFSSFSFFPLLAMGNLLLFRLEFTALQVFSRRCVYKSPSLVWFPVGELSFGSWERPRGCFCSLPFPWLALRSEGRENGGRECHEGICLCSCQILLSRWQAQKMFRN